MLGRLGGRLVPAFACVCMYVCMNGELYVYLNGELYVCMYLRYVCMYVRMYVLRVCMNGEL